jgi:hypothetical protein
MRVWRARVRAVALAALAALLWRALQPRAATA